MSLRRLALSLIWLGACGAAPAARAAATAAAAPASAARFHYDGATGSCVDGKGKAGFNAADPAQLFARQDASAKTFEGVSAECVDFSGFDFNKHIGLGFTNLLRWNLRGARFAGAKFHFANMNEADLRGTDLRDLEFGYTQISGTGDAHTQLPSAEASQGACKVESGNRILCAK